MENKAAKKWNEIPFLKDWQDHYYKNDYNGNRLRAREKKVLEYFDRLKLKNKSKVLELGFGAGLTSAKVYSQGYNVVGVDISSGLTDIATQNCKKIKSSGSYKFLVGDVEKLDFPDNHFDCVFGIGFIHYLKNPLRCIQEAKRVLKPGGYFIIAQRNMYGISSLDGPIKFMRSIYYYLSQRKFELRWADTFVAKLYINLTRNTKNSYIRKRRKQLIKYKQIGRVNKRLMSASKLKRVIKDGNFRILNYSGAGYLTKKYKLFPKLAKRVDRALQSRNNRKNSILKNFGNSVVILAKKD